MTAPALVAVRPRRGPAELIAAGHRSYSFEFFPPRTGKGQRALWSALRRVETLNRPSCR